MAARKVRIQTTINSNVYEHYIKKLLPEYGQLNKLIEEAVKQLFEIKENELSKLDRLRAKMMREAGVIAIGFESAEKALKGEIEKVLSENEINFLLEWYYGRPIEKIAFEEAIEFMRTALIAMNWAVDAKVNLEGEETYIMVRSNLGRGLAELLCMVIKHFFERNYGVEVRFSVYPGGYTLSFRHVSTDAYPCSSVRE
ncbi:MAG: hypothetical protein XD40_1567 [Archaeoglobus fulgidus]|jgi:hypothetical protein|uniref:Uncharacterized protein n=1 Tax=Archaeoglobus fulgidus TaxID=2234 RepID=A0A117KUN0_ARCFL|nr:hypothetical protein [Archaeoglobus fulgidus]KUJ93229.1 MAG: hypothetical protein XD40_1567 [Archaeoglobus fulgidus]KUK06880.1 MAG: hypothetical protein XD48_0876 [Archaeoglobus fulgidus]